MSNKSDTYQMKDTDDRLNVCKKNVRNQKPEICELLTVVAFYKILHCGYLELEKLHLGVFLKCVTTLNTI